ncbi:hypothetical protein HK405_007659, partial [Cladochytrium tenue]
FFRQEHLMRHQRSIHSGERPHQCRYCDKRFGRHDELLRHHRMHVKHRDAAANTSDRNHAHRHRRRSSAASDDDGEEEDTATSPIREDTLMPVSPGRIATSMPGFGLLASVAAGVAPGRSPKQRPPDPHQAAHAAVAFPLPPDASGSSVAGSSLMDRTDLMIASAAHRTASSGLSALFSIGASETVVDEGLRFPQDTDISWAAEVIYATSQSWFGDMHGEPQVLGARLDPATLASSSRFAPEMATETLLISRPGQSNAPQQSQLRFGAPPSLPLHGGEQLGQSLSGGGREQFSLMELGNTYPSEQDGRPGEQAFQPGLLSSLGGLASARNDSSFAPEPHWDAMREDSNYVAGDRLPLPTYSPHGEQWVLQPHSQPQQGLLPSNTPTMQPPPRPPPPTQQQQLLLPQRQSAPQNRQYQPPPMQPPLQHQRMQQLSAQRLSLPGVPPTPISSPLAASLRARGGGRPGMEGSSALGGNAPAGEQSSWGVPNARQAAQPGYAQYSLGVSNSEFVGGRPPQLLQSLPESQEYPQLAASGFRPVPLQQQQQQQHQPNAQATPQITASAQYPTTRSDLPLFAASQTRPYSILEDQNNYTSAQLLSITSGLDPGRLPTSGGGSLEQRDTEPQYTLPGMTQPGLPYDKMAALAQQQQQQQQAGAKYAAAAVIAAPAAAAAAAAAFTDATAAAAAAATAAATNPDRYVFGASILGCAKTVGFVYFK